MPLSPTSPLHDGEQSRAYKQAGRRLDQLAQAGMSWSGHERNCAYLNMDQGRFANISSAAGLDYTDDGRSLALVDWDHDGDVDLWAANRTGPRLRFLRNDTASGHRFLGVRLQGRSANRDAIGARLELTCDAGPALVRTLRAGDGFLGQSSKWLHFGMGDRRTVEKLVVRWPGGGAEEFTNLQPDRHYHIVQGDNRAERWIPPSRDVRLAPSELSVPPASDAIRIVLRSRTPLPRWEYTTLDGRLASHSEGKPVLLVLWASSCRPCVAELTDLSRRQDEISDLGLRVVALSVDSLADDAAFTDARTLLQEIQFPFDSGIASADLVDKLQLVHDHLFKPHRPLSVPASFLIDADGKLAAIYKGRLKLEDLRVDLRNLDLDRTQRLQAALPFDGRWFGAPRGAQLLPLAASLVEQGFVDDTIQFVQENRSELMLDPGFDELLHRLGGVLLERKQNEAALDWFREALRLSPDDAGGYYNLGTALAACNRIDEAIASYQRAIELDPAHVKAINNLGNAYLAKREFGKAEQVYLRALEVNAELADVHHNLANVYMSLNQLDRAQRHFAEAVRIDAGHARAHNNLGIILASRGDVNAAVKHYRQAIASDPDYAQAHNNLATAVAFLGDVDGAIEHYREAIRIQPGLADAHRNLGQTLVSSNQHLAALTHLREAVRLRPDAAESMAFLAWLLATHPDHAVRDANEALRLAERAAKLTKNRDPAVLDALAAAQAEAGHFDRAVRTAENAIQISTRANRSKQMMEIRKRQRLYLQRKPYRIKLPTNP